MDKTTQIKSLLTYYSKPIDSLPTYLAGVDDIDENVLAMAISELIKTSTWMPRVNEMRAAADSIVRRMRESASVTGDQLIAKLNELYDAALDGAFDSETWLRTIILLRNSDRSAQADAWRRRYDYFSGASTVDRQRYATDWGTVDAANFNPEAVRKENAHRNANA